jgi:hypothetical protein
MEFNGHNEPSALLSLAYGNVITVLPGTPLVYTIPARAKLK